MQGGNGSYAAASSVLQTGAGRPIAVPTEERMKKLPDVRDLLRAGRHRAGLPGARLRSAWSGPSGMPDEIVQRLSDLMVEGGKTERIQKILDTFGIDEAARDRVYFKKVIAEEGPVWIDLVKGLNIEPQ